MLTLHIQNLRALRLVRWPLAGVSVLTGANGVVKTTALRALRTLREAARTGRPYETRLDPPPADPRGAHPDTRKAT